MVYQRRLRSLDGSTNRMREYRIDVQPAVAGGHILTTYRGRIDPATGSVPPGRLRPRESYFPTLEPLIAELEHLLRLRVIHGYHFV